jgi:3-hydroxybutyryl-CoA dehydratase
MSKPLAVGDSFTHVRECDRYRPIYYAAASGDFNPIHIDPEAGKAAGLGGNILQGLCTLSWAVEGVVNYVGDPTRIARVRVRFSKPVMIDDTVTFKGAVTKIEGGRATFEVEAQNQRGEEVLKGAFVEVRV